ncbi:MAG: dehydrogenase/reductase SDR family protein 1 [Bradymonadia bacterium]|jgi:dehydrogenase/reductase SDR family protein 1
MTRQLSGKICVVTGASRGVGRGVALALGDAGATVYVTGRTRTGDVAQLPGTIDATAADVTARGGDGIAVACDHADDDSVRSLFDEIRERHGRIDLLVNNVFSVPEESSFINVPFWEQPLSNWDMMHRVGLRSHYVASTLAAPMMLGEGGVIATISSFGARLFQLSTAYGVGKAGCDKMARDMAVELKPHDVVSVGICPGVVRTERILEKVDELPFDLAISESPEFTGRVIAALFADPSRMEQTGKVHVVAELAEHYAVLDIDGSRPKSLRRSK